ncbi:response regulator transcription factor [Paenibacillus sp. GCM10012307]|uniref:Response regulator transcription factor n=1 Tax=Paenibacillus roseus TaxID=2798579 RepID=A0A934J2R6_9BACL|nr:response regulator transcription factor [Paenibacillus roseus]MBJ6360393.1 response regulator transcription factor [Paenibacillus roseus]
MTTILTVDDEQHIQDMLRIFLEAEGFEVRQAFSGEQCLAYFADSLLQPDLILLDIAMPDMDGVELCRRLRELYDHPVLFLSGNTRSDQRLLSLQAGGDDYLTKPLDHLELVARVRSHLRWSTLLSKYKKPEALGRRLSFPGLEIDLDRLNVTVQGEPVTLVAKELHLLLLLAQSPSRVYHPRQLYDLIWNDQAAYSPAIIKTQIYNLRKKIESESPGFKYIHTVKGFGYRFEPLTLD